jgi:hypothetical protein
MKTLSSIACVNILTNSQIYFIFSLMTNKILTWLAVIFVIFCIEALFVEYTNWWWSFSCKFRNIAPIVVISYMLPRPPISGSKS